MLPARMRAARLYGPGGPLRLEDAPLPAPAAGEALLRVRAAGVCHTELHMLDGVLNLGVAPLIPGHEVVGEVVETRAADGPRPGQRVLLYYYAPCGRCPYCRAGDENLCPNVARQFGFSADGGYAEYMAAPARCLLPLPDALADEDAVGLACGGATALHAARAVAALRAGETAVVYGVGGVGFYLVQVCHLAGAHVLAIGRTPAKLELAADLGADAAIDARAGDVLAAVQEHTGGAGADVVFDLVASAESMAAAPRMLARRGRLVFCGYGGERFAVSPLWLVLRELQVRGAVGNTLAELRETLDLAASGRLRSVVGGAYPLEGVNQALADLRAGRLIGRAVLRVGGPHLLTPSPARGGGTATGALVPERGGRLVPGEAPPAPRPPRPPNSGGWREGPGGADGGGSEGRSGAGPAGTGAGSSAAAGAPAGRDGVPGGAEAGTATEGGARARPRPRPGAAAPGSRRNPGRDERPAASPLAAAGDAVAAHRLDGARDGTLGPSEAEVPGPALPSQPSPQHWGAGGASPGTSRPPLSGTNAPVAVAPLAGGSPWGPGRPESDLPFRAELLSVIARGVEGPLAQDDAAFNDLALALFRFQYERNAPYRRFCDGRGCVPGRVAHWTELPAVPIGAFKEAVLSTEPVERAVACFMSSGTTRPDQRSRHYHPDLAVYDASARANFSAHLLADGARLPLLVLNPPPAALPNSSLAHYLGLMVEAYGVAGSGYFVDERGLDHAGLLAALEVAVRESRPVCLLGATFAFVHLLDRLAAEGRRLALPPGSRVMDTGGVKGRSREIGRDELAATLAEYLGLPPDHQVNMYGLTELSTQFLDATLRDRVAAGSPPPEVSSLPPLPGRDGPGVRVKTIPAWARTRVLHPETLAELPAGEVGLLCHTDLANRASVCTVLTEDLGVARGGGFEVLGRAAGSQARGCSIALDELLSATGGRA